jgi:SAM-dependent methyltransferase
MDLSTGAPTPTPATFGDPAAAVMWHELECGRYTADLSLWCELARESQRGSTPARILDVGAGTGRVTLVLAHEGHAVTALDLDQVLLDALAERAAANGLEVPTVCGDTRELALETGEFDLCVIPMQTIQLLGGGKGRLAFLHGVRTHLRAGALLACAIVTELEPFECEPGQPAPTPEVVRVGGVEYSSQATAVRLEQKHVRIDRVRTITGAEVHATSERNRIELDRVSATELAQEGREAGFEVDGVREIAATDEHVGGEVVLLRA